MIAGMADSSLSSVPRTAAEAVHHQRITALETATADAVAAITVLDRHRERMETRWALVAAFVGGVAGLAITGLYSAGATRDLARDGGARLAAVERELAAARADARTATSDARAMHDAIITLTATTDALRVQVVTLTSELHARVPR
jgi:hypothetical protein